MNPGTVATQVNHAGFISHKTKVFSCCHFSHWKPTYDWLLSQEAVVPLAAEERNHILHTGIRDDSLCGLVLPFT